MELFSPAFQARVAALLDDPGEVILVTVPMPRYGREIPFVGGIKCVHVRVYWGGGQVDRLTCVSGLTPHPSSPTHQRLRTRQQHNRARADVALVKVLKKTREEAFQEALSHILAALGLPKEST